MGTSITFTPALRAEYLDLWHTMLIRPDRVDEARSVASRLLLGLERYKALERRLNIPAAFIMCVHERESGGRWGTYLGNGQRLDRITTIVPKGRGPFDDFEDGAYDALIVVQGMGKVPLKDWDEAGLAWYLEGMNGFGYRNKGLRSPYLWGGTNHQQPGKYVADGVFDPSVMDTQLGGMAVYASIVAAHPELALGRAGTTPVPTPPVRPEQPPQPPPVPPAAPPPPAIPSRPTFWQQVRNFLNQLLGRYDA